MQQWVVYLSGEIHTPWRQEIIQGCRERDLPITWVSPVTDHAKSDDCGSQILGAEENPFWHDHKGARINAIRTRKALTTADLVIVRFGNKYRQWNAAFDAGIAYALGKPIICLHDSELDHALKEINAAAQASAQSTAQVVNILNYVITQE